MPTLLSISSNRREGLERCLIKRRLTRRYARRWSARARNFLEKVSPKTSALLQLSRSGSGRAYNIVLKHCSKRRIEEGRIFAKVSRSQMCKPTVPCFILNYEL